MTEDESQLPEDIRKALKDSPTLTPPESFYRAVLEKTERKAGRAEEGTPWYWGYPAKAFTAACILVVMVLVTRETRTTKPELLQSKPEQTDQLPVSKTESIAAFGNAPVGASAGGLKNAGEASGQIQGLARREADLVNTKEVQERVNQPIAGYVENPSPFEDIDAAARKDLSANKASRVAAVPQARSVALPMQQARDTASGAATQGSFLQEDKVLAKKQKAKFTPVLANSPVLSVLSAGGKAGSEGVPSMEWKGVISGIPTFQTVVVKSPEDWQTLWTTHVRYIVPPPPAPEIDFEKTMIVGIFAGTKVTAGFTVDITTIQTLSDQVVVTYRQNGPPAGMMTAQMLTEPYHLRAIPKSDLPVTFQKQQ